MSAINIEDQVEKTISRGTVFRCPVCGAELTVLAPVATAGFRPHCCSTAMEQMRHKAVFYLCEVCGAEVAVVSPECGDFDPHCCQQPMVTER